MFCVSCGLMDEIVGELNDHQECEDCERVRLDIMAIENDDYDVSLAGINPTNHLGTSLRRKSRVQNF